MLHDAPRLPSRVADGRASPPEVNTVVGVSDDAGDAATTLTPVQIRTLDALRRSGEPLVFDPDIVADIRTEMRVALDDFAERLRPNQEVFISKHKIATALDCEEFHVLPDDFEWKPATAKGQVAHRAIQLLLSWRGEANPSDLVDEAMARLADEERGIGAWIAGLSPADEADLRGQSVERLTKFMESFPPLDRRANPVTEAAARWPNEGPILLQARVDLMIGRPVGQREPQGDHRPQDRPTERPPPPGPRVLRAARDARPRRAARASWPRSTSTPPRRRPRT